MEFRWDESKNQSNRAKHGIAFEDAAEVFDDPLQLNVQDRHVEGEERWQTTGFVAFIGIVVVAHTITEKGTDNEVIRIISARKAERWERRAYEEGESR